MPSQARKKFDESAADIDHLMDMYRAMEVLWKDDPDALPEGIEVLFRSAAVLMVSHWEAYIEDICSEALEHLVTHAKNASALPKAVKQQIAIEMRSSKNDLELWRLADDGWKEVLRARLATMKAGRDRGFNSPKAQQTSDFIKTAVGVDDIANAWKVDSLEPKEAAAKLDALVALRGEIAHRGRVKERLDENYISDHVSFLRTLVAKTGGRINQHLKRITKKKLW
jgi:hypothetical protein